MTKESITKTCRIPEKNLYVAKFLEKKCFFFCQILRVKKSVHANKISMSGGSALCIAALFHFSTLPYIAFYLVKNKAIYLEYGRVCFLFFFWSKGDSSTSSFDVPKVKNNFTQIHLE